MLTTSLVSPAGLLQGRGQADAVLCRTAAGAAGWWPVGATSPGLRALPGWGPAVGDAEGFAAAGERSGLCGPDPTPEGPYVTSRAYAGLGCALRLALPAM